MKHMTETKTDKTPVIDYEVRLREDRDLSLRETSEYFDQGGTVLRTLRQLAPRLIEEGISYAIIGALALREHGFVRATVDIDLLMTTKGLEKFQNGFIGFGFRPAFPARKSFRATETGVRIDVILTGEFPGDGKPKAVAFPDPEDASFERNGMHFLKWRI